MPIVIQYAFLEYTHGSILPVNLQINSPKCTDSFYFFGGKGAHEINQWKNAQIQKLIKMHLGALLKVSSSHKKYRKWYNNHYGIKTSIPIVSSVVNARGGCGEADLC
jgi:hypothetical protein